MFLPLALILLGLVIAFGAFCFAARNIVRSATGNGSFDGMVGAHAAAMVVMFFGVLLIAIGIVLAIAGALS